MDNSKVLFEKERREKKSKLVNIVFVGKELFDVIDEKGVLKYHACLNADVCLCPSFQFGNTADYRARHGTRFQCKHLIQAHAEYEKKQRFDDIHENTQGMINKELLL